MKIAYPAPADLRSLLARAGIVLDTINWPDLTLQDYLDQAQGNFEGEIGRAMLGAVYTQNLDQNGDLVLPLPASCCRVDSVTITTYSNGANAPASALVAGTDYWPYPQRHGADGLPKPFEWLRFATPLQLPGYNSSRQSVIVTGCWGYHATQIPDIAWKAILSGAAVLLYPEVSGRRSDGAQSVTEGAIKEEFSNRADAGAYANEFTQWGKQYDLGVSRYRRVCVGLRSSGS